MKMLKKILLGLIVIIVVFVIVVATRPSEFTVTRSTSVAAPSAAVFEQVNDLHKWEAWNPWMKLDPSAKTTYEGPAAGVGAVSRWAGNSQVGEGSMTIAESKPNELVRFNLEFLKPFKGNATAEFTFKSEGNGTVVSWSMSGKNNFIAKAIGLFMDCDKMIGTQFEKGLADLKKQAETPAQP